MSNMWWENNYACIYMPFVKEIGFWKILLVKVFYCRMGVEDYEQKLLK